MLKIILHKKNMTKFFFLKYFNFNYFYFILLINYIYINMHAHIDKFDKFNRNCYKTITSSKNVQLILMNRIIIVMRLILIIILYTICTYLIIELILIYKILLNVSNKNLISHKGNLILFCKESRAASINHNHKNIRFHFKR